MKTFLNTCICGSMAEINKVSSIYTATGNQYQVKCTNEQCENNKESVKSEYKRDVKEKWNEYIEFEKRKDFASKKIQQLKGLQEEISE